MTRDERCKGRMYMYAWTDGVTNERNEQGANVEMCGCVDVQTYKCANVRTCRRADGQTDGRTENLTD